MDRNLYGRFYRRPSFDCVELSVKIRHSHRKQFVFEASRLNLSAESQFSFHLATAPTYAISIIRIESIKDNPYKALSLFSHFP